MDTRSISRLLLLSSVFLFAACGDDTTGQDASNGDAAVRADATPRPDATPNPDATTNPDGTTGDTGGGTGTNWVATLSGAQENPANNSTASGTFTANLNGTRLTYRLQHNVVGGTAAHIHLGQAGVNGAVIIPFAPFSADIMGMTDLNAAQVTQLQRGQLYVNVHSGAFAGGEIRGQVIGEGEVLYVAHLNAAEENPPTAATSTGTVEFVLNAAKDSLRYLVATSAQQTAMHIHQGIAGVNGPVVVPLMIEGGSAPLSAMQLTQLQARTLYANVHTAANPGGAIRGQILAFGETLFEAHLTPEQETPPVVAITSGNAMFIINAAGDMVSYYVTTTATPAAAHIHIGPGAAAGPVAIPLMPVGHIMQGSAAIPPGVGAYLAIGVAYVNVHTAANAGGEVRGQIMAPGDRLFSGIMSNLEEVPPTVSTATGSAALIVSADGSASGIVTYGGLTPTASHFHHGVVGMNGGVEQALQAVPGQSAFAANFVPTPQQLTDIRNGEWYANIHTAANPGGEIRGQLTPK